MNAAPGTFPSTHFDQLYDRNADPWSFETSVYEQQKYAATLGLLGRERYASALEIGCSIGIFTGQLARRCDTLLAIDTSEIALARARRRPACARVTFECRHVPRAFPDGLFDLIVLSEVLYYLSPADLEALAARCAAALRPEGEILLCHWLGATDYPQTGAAASDRFAAALVTRLPKRLIAHDEVYRLERLCS